MSAANATSPAGGDVVAGLAIEPYGAIPALWLTCFVFGNAFAIFWLARAFLNAHPEVAYQARVVLGRLGLRRRRRARAAAAAAAAAGAAGEPPAGGGAAAAAAAALGAGAKAAPPGSPLKPGALSRVLAGEPSGEQQLVGSPSGARRRQHTHLPPPIICTPSTELEGPGSGRLGSGHLSPRFSRLGGSPSARSGSTPRSPAAGGGFGPAPRSEAGSSSGSEGGSSCTSLSSQDLALDTPVQLEWVNMQCTVNAAGGRKTIVRGVYGVARPRELQGLMGPSGAGKSTLMDLLAMRTDHDGAAAAAAGGAAGDRAAAEAGGGGGGGGAPAAPPAALGGGFAALPSQLLVNGVPVKRQTFMAISAYVPQHDNLVPTMSALEAVTFYASIVLPPDTSKHLRRARIARVLRMMGLERQQHTLVGGTLPGGIMLRGMSGGERKRLAIACGVVAGPSLVFLDEPTSGLDSFAALNVVLFLKSMATDRGATLLASLHQPRSAIWNQLDQVTLLASGRLMYSGPTGGLVPWFASLGYAYDPEAHGMASDWALDLVSLGFTKPQHHAAPAAGAAGAAPAGAAPAADARAAVATHSSVQPHGGGGGCAGERSMMASGAELNDAADAFLGRLQAEHPHWFTPGGAADARGAAAADAAEAGGGSPAGGKAPPARGAALEARRWWRSDAGAPPPAGAPDGAAGGQGAAAPRAGAAPYSQRSADEAGPFASALAAASFAAAQQGGRAAPLPAPPLRGGQRGGALQRLRAGGRKYKALLWRELLITTRCGGAAARSRRRAQPFAARASSSPRRAAPTAPRRRRRRRSNPADVGGRMMTFTYVALISGLVSWSLPGDANSIFQRMSVAYAVLTFYFLMPFVFMSIFTADKRFFAADTAGRLYHPVQYYAAKVTAALPFNVVVAVVFHLIYYGMAGMRHGPAPMAASCLICLLTGLIGMQAVYCCAIVASSQDLAFVYAIGWTSLNLLVNPYMARYETYSLGWGFSWLRFASPCSFAWQALVDIEFTGRGFDCNAGSGAQAVGLIPSLLPDDPAYALIRSNINSLGRISRGGRCVASGDAIVAMYTQGIPYAGVVGVLLGYYVLFLAATYAVVARSARAKSKV
ncbi:abcG12 [Scenedesmus sp. PABB004]|nr:abcG12 [Scenedesmus sp. PABB004]